MKSRWVAEAIPGLETWRIGSLACPGIYLQMGQNAAGFLQKNHLSTAAPQITKNQISSCHVIAGLEAASISIKEK